MSINKKAIQKTLNILATPDTVSSLRSEIRDLLYGSPLGMRELLANFDKSEWDRVKNVIDKMAENEEVFKDKDDCWRLADG